MFDALLMTAPEEQRSFLPARPAPARGLIHIVTRQAPLVNYTEYEQMREGSIRMDVHAGVGWEELSRAEIGASCMAPLHLTA